MAAEHAGATAALPCRRMPHGEVAEISSSFRQILATCREQEVSEMIEAIMRLWCRTFHHEITRPLGGQYGCLKCLRMYEAGYR
jgi:hypothetical protein